MMEDTATIRANVLDTAKGYVCRDRQADHGKPENTFGTQANLWSAYLSAAFGADIKLRADHVAQMMVLFKVGRTVENPHNQDNYIDTAGYAACGAELAYQHFAPKQPRSAKEQIDAGVPAVFIDGPGQSSSIGVGGGPAYDQKEVRLKDGGEVMKAC